MLVPMCPFSCGSQDLRWYFWESFLVKTWSLTDLMLAMEQGWLMSETQDYRVLASPVSELQM